MKSSNILLTERMRGKVADFGFARVGEAETDNTHVVTKVRGTVGYLDPEYMRTYQLTPKSDVYSFGILLIEILTGRRPIESRRSPEEKVTIRWVCMHLFLLNTLCIINLYLVHLMVVPCPKVCLLTFLTYFPFIHCQLYLVYSFILVSPSGIL